MEKFQPAVKPTPSIKHLKRTYQIKKDRAKAIQREVESGEVFLNDKYNVQRRTIQTEWGEMYWLSIKRIDRECIHDWRDLQEIKNELVGPENEAVELYPAESRRVDTSNQYHLFVLKDPTIRFPFGWKERLILEPNAYQDKAKQRPFGGG